MTISKGDQLTVSFAWQGSLFAVDIEWRGEYITRDGVNYGKFYRLGVDNGKFYTFSLAKVEEMQVTWMDGDELS